MEDMENMLNGLRQMRTTNPEVFKQAMQSLGLPIDDTEGEGMDDTTSLSKMAEAIKQMRNQETPGNDGDNVLMSKDAPKQPKGISITPTPGFAFKTSRLSDKMKVFINMAQHEAIDEPGLKKKLDENGEEIEGMNIPMSVGAPVWGEDKKGIKCVIYDIIVNPVVITESVSDKTGKYRDFICQLGMQYLEQKYKEELDKRYKLPKLKYMGDAIASQMIQDRKSMPKIQEVSSKTHPTAAKAKTQAVPKAVVEVVDKDLQCRTEWLQATDSFAGAGQEREVMVREVLSAFSAPVSPDAPPSALYTLQPYTHQLLEYVDPIFESSDNTVAIVIQADVAAYELDVLAVAVQISPFKVSVKLPGYRKVVLYLACAVLPCASYYTLSPPYEGCLSALRLQVVLQVDRSEWTASADPGSKTWLLSQALSGEDGAEANPYSPDGAYRSGGLPGSVSGNTPRTADGEGDGFAEDKFHLQLPADVDQYTGMKLDGAVQAPDLSPLAVRNGIPTGSNSSSSSSTTNTKSTTQNTTAASGTIEDEQEFPEDRFHKKDAASNYMIQQREQARRDKWAKHEKEKAERADDPNVEYVDMDDFRPGGKYGPKEEKKVLEDAVQTEDMRRAAEVVANAANITTQENGIKLSSALWTELLD